MEFWTLSLIALFHFNFTMAEWDPNSALVLVRVAVGDGDHFEGFPPLVRIDEFGYKVYHKPAYVSTTIIDTYCPSPEPQPTYPSCIYATSSLPFKANQYTQTTRPNEICDAPVPYLKTTRSEEGTSREFCSNNDSIGILYRFLYLLCQPNVNPSQNSLEIKIYEVCYQEVGEDMFARYTITTPHLLNNNLLADEQNYPFQNHLPPDELYNQNPLYKPRSVLPSEWLPFGLQRRTLFDDMNMAPMHELLIPGWEALIINLKHRLSQLKGHVYVTAGFYGTAQDDHGRFIILKDAQGLPQKRVPSVWWIMIQTEATVGPRGPGVVIVMHNKPYTFHNVEANMTLEDTNICGRHVCDDANLTGSMVNYLKQRCDMENLQFHTRCYQHVPISDHMVTKNTINVYTFLYLLKEGSKIQFLIEEIGLNFERLRLRNLRV